MAAIVTIQSKYQTSGIEYGQLKVSFTNADIKGLGTATTLIAAPGSGKIIQLIDIVNNFTYGGAVFATSTDLQIKCTGGIVPQSLIDLTDNSASGISLYAVTPANGTAAGVNSQLIANTALIIQTSDAVNPTAGGTSSMILYLSYKIITL